MLQCLCLQIIYIKLMIILLHSCYYNIIVLFIMYLNYYMIYEHEKNRLSSYAREEPGGLAEIT